MHSYFILETTIPELNQWKPPCASQSQNLPPSTDRDEKPGHEAYYIVLYRKFTTKKHKTWDGDGVLSVVGGYARLQDVDGRELGRTPCKTPLLPESQLSVGGKEVEIGSQDGAQRSAIDIDPVLCVRWNPCLSDSVVLKSYETSNFKPPK